MSFIAELKMVEPVKVKTVEERRDEINDQMMVKLTEKYLMKIREAIINAVKYNKKEKYMNFERDDFKANFPGMPKPWILQSNWLHEMINPESKYVPTDENGNKMTLEGINFDVWNNKKFTTHFTWNLN